MTRSRGVDVLLFACVLVVMLGLSPRLRVYYDVTVVDVRVERLHADGSRELLPTPPPFEQFRSGYSGPERIRAQVEEAIDRHMARVPPEELGGSGARILWTVRYSHNSTALDQRHTVLREVRDVPD